MIAAMSSMHTSPASTNRPVKILAWMMFLVPALGVPSELVLQDTLKSAIVAFGVLIAALVSFWQQRRCTRPLLWHGMVWLPITLMLYALGSMVWSHTYLAGVEAVRWFILALLMWLGLNTLNRDTLPTLLWGIHAGAVVASLWVALQFWFDFQLFPQAAAPASTFINRNFFAEYAVCALPFSACLLVNQPRSKWLPWLAASVTLVILAILMTGTRSALLALALSGPLFLVLLWRYRTQFAMAQWRFADKVVVTLILTLGLAALGSIPSGNPDNTIEGFGNTALQRSVLRSASIAKPAEYTEGSFSIRSTMWKATARMMMANPWTGVGAGAWEVQIPLYQRIDTNLETDYYAHNEYLQLLSEYGVLVGGLALAILLAFVLLAMGHGWHLTTTAPPDMHLRLPALASLAALLVVSIAGFPWHLAACGAMLALSLAMLAATDVATRPQGSLIVKRVKWQPGYNRLAIALVVVSILLATYVTQRAMRAEYKTVHALELASQFRAANLAHSDGADAIKSDMLQETREGITLNPHYRRFTALVAESLVHAGDWPNALWILETVAASRPQVSAIWAALANGYSTIGAHGRAWHALQQVQRLKPEAVSTLNLELAVLGRAGRGEEAVTKLTHSLDLGQFDFESLQTGYALGYQMRNWKLAERSLELRNQTWPSQAADGHFRLGQLYADATAMNDPVKALQEFKTGLALVPPREHANFLRQVPAEYRPQM